MRSDVLEELLNAEDDPSGVFARDELFGNFSSDELLSTDDLDTDVFEAGA